MPDQQRHEQVRDEQLIVCRERERTRSLERLLAGAWVNNRGNRGAQPGQPRLCPRRRRLQSLRLSEQLHRVYKVAAVKRQAAMPHERERAWMSQPPANTARRRKRARSCVLSS